MTSDKLSYSFHEDSQLLSSSFSYKEGNENVTLMIQKDLNDLNPPERVSERLKFIEENLQILTYIRDKLNG